MATALTQAPVVWLSWWALDRDKLDGMDRNHLERCHEMGTTERGTASKASYVSLETEIPEVLYRGMKDFIGEHPTWGPVPRDEFCPCPLPVSERL